MDSDINNEKMSKSLGNFFTIRDVLKRVHPEALRLFLLSKHYRSPVDFSDESVGEPTVDSSASTALWGTASEEAPLPPEAMGKEY